MPCNCRTTPICLWLLVPLVLGVYIVRSCAALDAARPDYCRPDLPGCCPRVVKHVFFLHIEKTGGTHARGVVKAAVGKRFDGAYACNYLERAAYDCLPTTEEAQRPWCNRINQAYYKEYLRTGRHFSGSCALTAGHHDFKMFEAFPDALKPSTLLITNLREPVARLVSHYHMLQRFNYTPAFQLNMSSLFLAHRMGIARTRNKQTRMVSGDFCCANGTAIQYNDTGLLDKALSNLDRFCVIGLTERMDETLEYLHFVLGLPYTARRANGTAIRAYEGLDPETARLFKLHNQLDERLFQAALTRFDAQMHAIRRAKSAAAGAGVQA